MKPLSPGLPATAERPRYAIGPLCMSISVSDLEAWMDRAEPGDRLTYAHGPVLDRSRDVVQLAARYRDEGEVMTHQARVDGVMQYFVVRRAPEVRPARAQRAGEPEAETPQGRILAILRRCVRHGLPCRTNAELAREVGLRNAEAARYEFNRLADAGLISVRNMGARERRVVTIGGKSTPRGAL